MFQAARHTLSLLLVASAIGCGAGEAFLDVEELEELDAELSVGRFETFVGRNGQYYFQLLAGNGEQVLASEGYTTLTSAKNGVASVRSNGTSSANYQLRQDSSGQSYVVLVAGNGQVIAVGQRYGSAATAITSVATLVRVVKTAVGPFAASTTSRFQLFKGVDGQYRFHLRAANGEIVLVSERYTSRSGALNGIQSVQTNGVSPSKYEVRVHADGRAHFVLKAGNGQVIANSQTYASRAAPSVAWMRASSC
jgi:uncharacterized protein